eukprot:augustus_masked-scaffold_4-processed-gene-8.55-mRNA-1 protein AED:0.12 eAED:0.12 QI:0/0/0/0.5/1/1/2/0/576
MNSLSSNRCEDHIKLLEEARYLANSLKRKNPNTHSLHRGKSSHQIGAKPYVESFFKASRLHFIGTWKQRYQKFLKSRSHQQPNKFQKYPENKTWILHVDMDAFFANVSLNEVPHLNKKLSFAICWGEANVENSSSEISCANYVARSKGIRAGEWLKTARLKDPNLITLPFEFEKYSETALKVYEVLFNITPFILGVSCDEAYLDVSHLLENVDDPEKEVVRMGRRIRTNVFASTKCTCSIGIGHNVTMARLATKKAKPDGLFILDPYFIQTAREEYIGKLNISSIPSVGRKTQRLLRSLGISTCVRLQKLSLNDIKKHLGDKNGERLFYFCRGVDRNQYNFSQGSIYSGDDNVEQLLEDVKSMSAQVSYGVRMEEGKECYEFIEALCEQLISRFNTKFSISDTNKIGFRGVSIKVWKAKVNADPNRMKGFLGHGQCDIIQRQKKMSSLEVDASILCQNCVQLFKELNIQAVDVRGLGVVINSFAMVNGKKMIQTKFNIASGFFKVKSTGIIQNKIHRNYLSKRIQVVDLAEDVESQMLTNRQKRKSFHFLAQIPGKVEIDASFTVCCKKAQGSYKT